MDRRKWLLPVMGGVVSLLATGSGRASSLPDDPYLPYQTALLSSVSEAWEIASDASSVIVAVIDTGVDLEHPDLLENLWVGGYDFRHGDPQPEDEWGHGTLVAGIIGAVGNNGVGTAGVAWSVPLMVLKVFGASGGGRMDDFVAAIRYAIRNGARIINAGWTIPASSGDSLSPLRDAIEEAREAGVLIVAAAGNDSRNLDETPVFPAGYLYDHLISVAAVGEGTEELLSTSNFGRGIVSVAAPGENLLAPYLSGSYAALTGTSAAAAVVSGVAALMLAQNPDLSPSRIREILMETSDPVQVLEDLVASAGILNPLRSLSAALGTEVASDAPPVGDSPLEGEPFSASGSFGCNLR